MLAEFDLIRRYFTLSCNDARQSGVALGVGDDAALLTPQPEHQLVVSVDTSVADVHFPSDAPADAIGHRALAVALSDLAAMGATSRWCLMALTLDQARFADDSATEAWLTGYARGFSALSQRHATVLAGGDVTSGSLSIAVTVMGEVPSGKALTRSGAQPGHVIAVTGALGGGAGGLAAWQQGERDSSHPLLARYLWPIPRLEAGEALRELASAAIDISDGLLADLGHLREASGVGADLSVDALPLAEGLEDALGTDAARQAALTGGDDYELLVTLPSAHVEQAQLQLAALGVPLHVIGECRDALGIHGLPAQRYHGWQHFKGETP
ncbi:thiamine-phosphate kinase [Vreelandella arcis]|uniref:Thiamine-monophosphate kinase n=1 Tax=Vreelandella arcis TaxID=416873 RepID=A0A1H0CQP4_9GAMM|nr:thiamine-phosphate kinase [Halomonas arcis]SDN60081.1 thiamine-monophosphate kinase [Halomonas arcis]